MSSYCERAKLIDLMQLTSSTHVTKYEMDSGRKAEYYDAILSGKNGPRSMERKYSGAVCKLTRRQIQFLIMRV